MAAQQFDDKDAAKERERLNKDETISLGGKERRISDVVKRMVEVGIPVDVGGESGGGPEYLWDSTDDWRTEFNAPGRRIMRLEWSQRLLAKARAAEIPFFFKQTTAFRSGSGEDALGRLYQEFPQPPFGVWAEEKSQKPQIRWTGEPN
jgi:hypothetical protein